MKTLHKIYHFLGSVYFAIFLIASAALFVVAGTLIESITDSHRYAAYFTYNNPLFIALLWGFFINILISALRRWPFKQHHIPFLITHIGLLMILGGTLIKTSYGLQGTMGVMEGSSSQEIFIPDTYVVRLDDRESENPIYFHLNRNILGNFHAELKPQSRSKVKMSLGEYVPNSYERLETWIKGDMAYISGLRPFPVYDLDDISEAQPLPISTRVHLQPENDLPWNILAGRTSNIEAVAQKAYLQYLEISLTDNLSQAIIYKGPFKNHIKGPENQIEMEFVLNYSPGVGFENPSLLVTLHHNDQSLEKVCIPLQGTESLININQLTPFLGKTSFTVDLTQTPSLVFLQDLQDDLLFMAFDEFGRLHNEIYEPENLRSYIVYNKGFDGYGVQAKIPFKTNLDPKKMEVAQLNLLKNQLREQVNSSETLFAPLQQLQQACTVAKVDFEDFFVDFLKTWNHTNSWLFPTNWPLNDSLAKVLNVLNWDEFPIKEKNAAYWTHLLFTDLEPQIKEGIDLISLLKKRKWPLIKPLEELKLLHKDNYAECMGALLQMLTQQVFFIADQLPEGDKQTLSNSLKARLLSASLRAQGIHLSKMDLTEVQQEEYIHLESPLTARQHNRIPSNKLEDNLPKITLRVSEGIQSEWITLTYDRFGQGIKWPVLNGKYRIRFQPHYLTIPYKVRLRNARQINYANSSQPYSFESDLIFTNMKTKESEEKTISMNNVHETWEGHRFYLSNISPPTEIAAKRIQLVVNYDPAKYWMTYPGALILTLGITLLFWFKKRKLKD